MLSGEILPGCVARGASLIDFLSETAPANIMKYLSLSAYGPNRHLLRPQFVDILSRYVSLFESMPALAEHITHSMLQFAKGAAEPIRREVLRPREPTEVLRTLAGVLGSGARRTNGY
jgi:hypothetical protein